MRKRDVAVMRRKLLTWYATNRRDLPWRRRPTLYRTLVAEFMLQQTRADQATPYYLRFMRVFPTMRKLAAAPLGQVVKLWEGLGYYRRAAQLHQTTKRLAGRNRVALDDLRTCPGIGPYTLAAVGSIVLAEPLPVVDGNVKRVVARMIALEAPPEAPDARREISATLAEWISQRAPGNWNQAMMELGATVCTPRAPRCSECPVSPWCDARRLGRQDDFPVRKHRAARPHKHIAAAIIHRKDGRILIAQRLADGLLPNLWEFPGGKQEPGESLEECCRREIREELGIEIRVGQQVDEIEHAYSHYSITLHVFECRYVHGRPRTLGCQAWRWVRPHELAEFAFPRANKLIVDRLTGSRTLGGPSP
jgi:A/G-specific adenine glycosylase